VCIYIYRHIHTQHVEKKRFRDFKGILRKMRKISAPKMSKHQCALWYGWWMIFVLSLQQMLCVTPMLVKRLISFSFLKKCIFFKKCLVLLVFPKGLSLLVAVNTYKSLMVSEHIKVFTCLHFLKYGGLKLEDCAGQLNAPLCPVHCWLKVWFRCYLTMWRHLKTLVYSESGNDTEMLSCE